MAREIKLTENGSGVVRAKYNARGQGVVTVSYSIPKESAERIAALAGARGISRSKVLQDIINNSGKDTSDE